MRRVLVTGSRDWKNRTAIWNVLNQELVQFPEGIVVVHGGRKSGADDIADRWAWGMHGVGHNVVPEVHKPDYEKFGDRATLRSNREMAESGVAVCHAFPLEGSRDTRHCMTRCFAAGVPVVNHGFLPCTTEAWEFARAYG